jgi:hypothetical protein
VSHVYKNGATAWWAMTEMRKQNIAGTSEMVDFVCGELATAHRRIEHLTARMRYWRTQATGYPDSRQQREARRKG